MTLKEKFKIINCNDCDMPYCEIKCTILKPSELNHLEKIADDFAVNFANWLILKCDYQRHGIFEYLGEEYTNKELLEIYKQQIK